MRVFRWTSKQTSFPKLSFFPTLSFATLFEVDAQDSRGFTPLHIAVQSLGAPPMVKLLLTRGADPLRPNTFGISPISLARQFGLEVNASF